MRAHRNRHLSTLMHCCATWEPVGQCFDQCSSECKDFHGLSHTGENCAVHSLPWTQTEKDHALAKCRLSLQAWVSEKPMLCLHAITNEEGHPLEDEDESGVILCTYWSKIFESRTEGERHPAHETTHEFVQKDPEDIQWTIDKQEFDEKIVTKKNLLLALMVFPMVSTGALVDWVPASCTMHKNVCWKVVLSPHILPQAEPSSFPSLPMSTTMVSL